MKIQTVKGYGLNQQAEPTLLLGRRPCVGTQHFGLRALHRRGLPCKLGNLPLLTPQPQTHHGVVIPKRKSTLRRG